MARGVFVLFLVLGEFCRVAALNPSKALTQYSISHWTQEQGLPQNTISAIAQTADGYLWLGTDEGLARFDGYEFVVFSRDTGKLPSNSILALVAGPDGALWIGTPSGLTEYRNRTFRTYTQKEGLPGNSVSSLFVDHAGILWIVAGGNLSRFDGSRFTNYLRERDIPINVVRAVTEDARHILYVSGTNSVAQYVNGKFVELIPAAALHSGLPGQDFGGSRRQSLDSWRAGAHSPFTRRKHYALRRSRGSFGFFWAEHDSGRSRMAVFGWARMVGWPDSKTGNSTPAWKLAVSNPKSAAC